jgi:xanthine dehydrogenase accessory factor
MNKHKLAGLGPETHALAARPFTENVIGQLLVWRNAGIPSALVTLVAVEGSAPRRIGSQMAVNDEGEHLGYISTGCAEAAIVAEAQDAIQTGTPRSVRYGAGSKYVDIVLPCGSGVDIYFDPSVSTKALEELNESLLARQPAAMTLDVSRGTQITLSNGHDLNVPQGDDVFYSKVYLPPLRVIVAGRGVNVDYVARFAHQLEWDVCVATPDHGTIDRVAPFARHCQHLTRPEDFDASGIDPYTAVILLFHDHEWEPTILSKCQGQPAFFVGALGSRRTHSMRKMMLEELGCDPAFINSIRGPVGLSLGAKNPAEIAVAIVGEILSESAEMSSSLAATFRRKREAA